MASSIVKAEADPQISLQTPLKLVIGEKMTKALTQNFGWQKPTVEELLRNYPYRYLQRGEFTPLSKTQIGELATVAGTIKQVTLHRSKTNKKLSWILVLVNDGEGEVEAKFFNQNWRLKQFQVDQWGIFSGVVEEFSGKLQLVHPELQIFGDEDDMNANIEKFAGKYIPVYHSTKKLRSESIRKSVNLVLDSLTELEDSLPLEIRKQKNFPTLLESIREIHQKTSEEKLQIAYERLKFDEAFVLQTLLLQRARLRKLVKTKKRDIALPQLVAKFESKLPFTYTEGQKEVIREIENDLNSDTPMHRLLQGEVGSGKTVIALRAMLQIISRTGQALLIAPTEVLATQHFLSITNILGELALGKNSPDKLSLGEESSIKVEILTGSTPTKKKSEIKKQLKDGEIDLIIGTHALISEGVDFHDLALVVVDEQHRFGVEQRDALRMKAKYPPHILVMTATPIPRTIAMTFFGDLDTSTLRSLPKNRKPISTHLVNENTQKQFVTRTWERVKEEVTKGHQVYIVTPRIGSDHYQPESALAISKDKAKRKELMAQAAEIGLDLELEELSTDKNATSLYEKYQELASSEFSQISTGILHGGQSSIEKTQIMNDFATNKISVLFSTTVIEVGVDVPNATMMVICDADRFGISQLHQLRGRVGRGENEGLAIFLTKVAPDSNSALRLTQVANSTDGFELANIDLQFRKEGNVLGAQQSGSKSMLRLIRVIEDIETIEEARNWAVKILDSDPNLENNINLKKAITILEEQEAASYLDKN
mgnify:CR=1 FL=1